MVIDLASVFAERYKNQPQVLQQAVLGQSPVPSLNSWTALRALQLLKESQQMQMAQAAQQPTQSPSLVQAAMQMPQAPMGMPVAAPQSAPQAAPQQAPMMAASGGLASMPTPDEDYAEGGIVAFARGGDAQVAGMTGGGMRIFGSDIYGDDDEGLGDNLSRDVFARRASESSRAALLAEREEPMSPEEELRQQARVFEQLKTQAGASPFDAFLAKYNITPEKAAKMDDEDLGMALLKAAGVAVQPGGTTRGLAAAAATLGETYGAAKKARRQEEMSIARMNAEILDSQRKERMGMSKEASAAMERARKARQDAIKDRAQAHRLDAQTNAQLAMAYREPRGAAGDKEPKPESAGIERIAKSLIQKGMDPTEAYAQATLQYKSAGAGVSGVVRSRANAEEALSRAKILGAEQWAKYVKDNFGGDEAKASVDFIGRYMEGALPPFVPRGVSAPPAGAAPAAPAATAPRVTNW